MIKFYLISILSVVAFPFFGWGGADGATNALSVGQGISSPSRHSHVNFSSGFLNQNPVGAVYQQGGRVSGQFIDAGDNTLGVELGYGAGTWGVAIGATKSAGSDSARVAGAIGVVPFDSFGFGVFGDEDISQVGFLFSPHGTHRLGVTYAVYSEDVLEDLSTIGLGYSFVADKFTLTLDASKHESSQASWSLQTGDTTQELSTDLVFVTVGFMFRVSEFQFVINHEMIQNDDDNAFDATDTWFGVGFALSAWNFAIYSDYIGDLAINATYKF